MELNGAVAVVTGAARGIGRAIAMAYGERGAHVAIVDILADELARTTEELKAAGGRVMPILADVTKVAEVDAMVDQVEQVLGPIDIQVNNAGTFSYIGPVWEAEPKRWFHDIRVNLYGSFLCCRAAVRRMLERQRGYVINIVGGGVGDPHPYSTSYACSKAGLMRLTEGLAREVEPHGVKVFAVAPPAVDTAMTRFIMEDPGGAKWRPGFRRIFEEHRDHPPELVAELCVKLISGRADSLSGRYFPATRSFDEIVGQAATILKDDLMTLRIR